MKQWCCGEIFSRKSGGALLLACVLSGLAASAWGQPATGIDPPETPRRIATPAAPDGPYRDELRAHPAEEDPLDFMSMVFVFMLSTFIGLGVIQRVSRLLHTPLMSLTNAISAISVVGAIIVAGGEHYPTGVRLMGSIALFASMTNIISGFLITDRMLKMFKTPSGGKA